MKCKINDLLEAMSNSLIVVLSWGINNLSVSKHCIAFSVNSFKYSGVVILSINGKTYRATLHDDNNIVLVSNDANTLIYILDKAIERTETYKIDILNWNKDKL